MRSAQAHGRLGRLRRRGHLTGLLLEPRIRNWMGLGRRALGRLALDRPRSSEERGEGQLEPSPRRPRAGRRLGGTSTGLVGPRHVRPGRDHERPGLGLSLDRLVLEFGPLVVALVLGAVAVLAAGGLSVAVLAAEAVVVAGPGLDVAVTHRGVAHLCPCFALRPCPDRSRASRSRDEPDAAKTRSLPRIGPTRHARHAAGGVPSTKAVQDEPARRESGPRVPLVLGRAASHNTSENTARRAGAGPGTAWPAMAAVPPHGSRIRRKR